MSRSVGGPLLPTPRSRRTPSSSPLASSGRASGRGRRATAAGPRQLCAVRLRRGTVALARLWGAVGEFGAGFVLDTCHAWAAGWDLATAVDDVRAITGRVDLVHLNNSRDPQGSSRDRHAPLADGEIPTELLVEVARSADCPVVLETPGDAASHAEEITLLRQALA